MSNFAVTVSGLIFGWGLCSIFLRWERPFVSRYVFETRWPNVTRYSPMLESIGAMRRRALEDPNSLLSRDRLKQVRRWFGLAVFLASAAMIMVHVFEELHWHFAAEVEYFLVDQRASIPLLAATLGFGSRAFLQEIVTALVILMKVALVPPKSSADNKKNESPSDGGKRGDKNELNYFESKFPWFVEIGLVASIVVIAVLLFNPALLKNLTSFKAGGVEAHFAAATGTATVQSGQLVSVDLSRNSTARVWASFDYPLKDSDPRFRTYSREHDSLQDIITASILFKDYLKPIFRYIAYLDKINRPIPFDVDGKLRNLVADIRTMVQTRRQSDHDLRALLIELAPTICSPSIPSETKSELCEKIASFGFPAELDTPRRWDPYVIQAVGDLMFVLTTRQQQQDFLVAATSDAAYANTICPVACVTAGQLSLSYALILAKVRSERPWPIQDMIDDLTATLDAIDAVLDRNKNEWRKPETDALFHRNRLIDLSLGLELFYQRALRGQRFTRDQLQTWRAWLTEVDAVVAIVDDPFVTWPPRIDDATQASWSRAKTGIVTREDILPDVYVGAALGWTLIDPADEAHPEACRTARSFLTKLDHASAIFITAARLSEVEKGSYKGFLEQVSSHVDERCPP